MEKLNIIKKITSTKRVNTYIDFDVLDDGIMCNNYNTLKYVWGASTGSTDLKHHGIKSYGNGKWFVPKDVFEKRAQLMLDKLDTLTEYIKIHNSIKGCYEELEK